MHDDATYLIPLHARDGSIRAHAIVDAIDIQWVTAKRWSLHSGKYAFRLERVDQRRVAIFLHREVLGLPPNPGQNRTHETDHINRDTLDNRRANLRFVTRSENMKNRGPWSKRTDVSKGSVRWYPEKRKWRAQGHKKGKRIHLGYFARREDGQSAVDSWRAQRSET